MRYRLNVVGDFYVEDACCTLCGVPWVTAPELFGGFEPDGSVLDATEHCWVKRQPESDAELAAMIDTMSAQEFDCIRYGGKEPAIVERIREIDRATLIDSP